MKNRLTILQVNTSDIGGGAEKIAWDLYESYLARGHRSYLAVGTRFSSNPNVLEFPDMEHSPWERFWNQNRRLIKKNYGKKSWARYLNNRIRFLENPELFVSYFKGREDFEFPGTSELLNLHPEKADIVHCHNLHGGYFDLRVLPKLSKDRPVVLTLHDAWLISGHCAHSFRCERWKTGCGDCQDLSIYPAIFQDGTSYNWRRKKEIYENCRLYVATPCKWLIQKVKQSIMNPGIIESRIIPNGINLDIFYPADKQAVRKKLNLPLDSKIMLFTAYGIRKNIWKDFETLKAVVHRIAKDLPRENILFVALGESSKSEKIGRIEIRFIPYQKDPHVVAQYFQAADVYVHSAHIDTFPNTILEALACGLPVVASSVGGIPEQIIEGVTGFLSAEGNYDLMAKRVEDLLQDENLWERMSIHAAEDARKRFDLNLQVDTYLSWYEEIR